MTPDLLAEAGYRYLLDWCMDDQPIWFNCRGGGRILAVPYPQEVNDIPAIVARKVTGAAEFADMIVDQFDEMLELSRDAAAGDGRRAARLSSSASRTACAISSARCATSRQHRERDLAHHAGRHRAHCAAAAMSAVSPAGERRGLHTEPTSPLPLGGG